MTTLPCPDFAGTPKGAKGSRKGGKTAVLRNHDFEQPPYNIIGNIQFLAG